MILLKCKTLKRISANNQGLTLIEMLVTALILTLAAALLAIGVPVAAETYHKVVNSANAQIALSTTLTVLRTELGTSADVRVVPDGSVGDNIIYKVYYQTEEGYWASITNPVEHSGKTFRGLEKQYYAGKPNKGTSSNSVEGLGDPFSDMYYPLVSDSAVSAPLHVRFTVGNRVEGDTSIKINISVVDEATSPNILASVDNYLIMLRFEE